MFRRWGLGVFARTKWNYDGDRGDTRYVLFANSQLKNYYETRLDLFYAPRALSDDLTRGGPLMTTPRFLGGAFSLNSNFSSPNSWRIGAEASKNELGGSGVSVVGSVGLRPSSKFGFSVDPQWYRQIEKRQYVTTLEGGLPATYDRRYVFATSDQTVLAATIRLNYTFKPDVTLELFAQPFTASGDYYGYSEQAEPRALALREYGTDGTTITAESDQFYRVNDSRTGTTFQLANQNFSDFSFRSSVVLGGSGGGEARSTSCCSRTARRPAVPSSTPPTARPARRRARHRGWDRWAMCSGSRGTTFLQSRSITGCR